MMEDDGMAFVFGVPGPDLWQPSLIQCMCLAEQRRVVTSRRRLEEDNEKDL